MTTDSPLILRPFGCSAILMDVLGNKVNLGLASIERLLTENLSLEDYGKLVLMISVNFIAVPAENKNHSEQFHYFPRAHELYIQLKLPYKETLKASPEAILQKMAQRYLAACSHCLQLEITDFDLLRFKEDLYRLFVAKGWV